MPRLCSSLLLSLLIASPASAVAMEWTFIDTYPGGGGVGYDYSIGTYEVTNAQYAEFLNAVAATDPNGLYPIGIGSGISYSGEDGSYSYSVVAGREQMPVNNVSFFDALRFANWLQNGQPTGNQDSTTTEDGAYTFFGPRTFGGRNDSAMIVLPTEDEWYKAAYYDPASASYFDYPTGSKTQTVCSLPYLVPNSANCNFASSGLTFVGSYLGSASPYGTYDQGGNVFEWTETRGGPREAIIRGGSFQSDAGQLSASARTETSYTREFDWLGFRVARLTAVPEPSTSTLLFVGLVGLAGWRRTRA